ncbi:alpha/beta hydrolase [Flavobacterium cupreum]|uniref:Alpha/beta hydrolase n=1 Tax=Flavobacterium cupreum TaxID=2133766 RepID=A0A434ACQ0_9FLAO|nr:alpha/beta hydrolase [Flavobacterium cupreum]RUT72151.1 alpha/beta hydrolase [Flavobacterium cupreum]
MKMFKFKSLKGLAVVAVLALSSAIAQSTFAQEQISKNVVLVHGAFADGSGYRKVYEILTHKGYNVRVVQLPLTGLADDVAAVNRVLDQVEGPTVLVGHSWAGAVISEAGTDPKVASLVFIAAFVPDMGETAAQWASTYPAAPENGITAPDPYGYLFYSKDKYHAGFAADISKKESDFMEASQVPILAASFGTALSAAAWKTKPVFAIVTLEDKNIHPDLQRKMYERANAAIVEIKSSHVVYISHPAEVADLIVKASKTNK